MRLMDHRPLAVALTPESAPYRIPMESRGGASSAKALSVWARRGDATDRPK